MKAYKYLLFDADDTLLDFKKAEHEAFRLLCSEVGIDFSEEVYAVYSEINDRLWKRLEKKEITLEELKPERFRQLLRYLRTPDEALEGIAMRMRDGYMAALGKQSFLLRDAEEVCRRLSEKYPIYLITNGVTKIQRARMEHSAIKPYVQQMFVSEEIGVSKPAAAYFDYVLNVIGDPERGNYLVIGDSLTSDMAGAVGYGLDCCFFNPAGRTTDLPVTYTIEKLTELYEIL